MVRKTKTFPTDPGRTILGLYPCKSLKFTLVELLIVVAILTLLASLLMPQLISAVESARVTTCASNEKQLGTAVVLYRNDNFDMDYPAMTWGYMPHQLTGGMGFVHGNEGANIGNWAAKYVLDETQALYEHRTPWSVPFGKPMGYLVARTDKKWFDDRGLRDPGARNWVRENPAEPGTVEEGERFSTYPYMVRLGSYYDVGSPRCAGIYQWAAHKHHPNPSLSIMTQCPFSYSSGGHTGSGITIGTHYMRGTRYWGFPPGWPPAFTVPLFGYWRGSNLLFGDGSVRWIETNNNGNGFQMTYQNALAHFSGLFFLVPTAFSSGPRAHCGIHPVPLWQ